jgi:hypothetical protein
MHPADTALQGSFPSVMVPRFGQLAAMDRPGERCSSHRTVFSSRSPDPGFAWCAG